MTDYFLQFLTAFLSSLTFFSNAIGAFAQYSVFNLFVSWIVKNQDSTKTREAKVPKDVERFVTQI
jgi:hypothetical protein